MPVYSIKRLLYVGFKNMPIFLVEIPHELLSVDKALEVRQLSAGVSSSHVLIIARLSGGSVMMQAMAYGGGLNNSLFKNVGLPCQ